VIASSKLFCISSSTSSESTSARTELGASWYGFQGRLRTSTSSRSLEEKVRVSLIARISQRSAKMGKEAKFSSRTRTTSRREEKRRAHLLESSEEQ